MRVGPQAVAVLALCLSVAQAAAVTLVVPGDHPTIQAAIDAAAPDTVIQIAPGHYTERLVLHEVAHALTIRGNPDDPAAVVVDGGGVAEAISVTSCGSNLVFEGITVTGGTGKQGYGGGLYMADSDAVFRRCVFTGNAVPLDG